MQILHHTKFNRHHQNELLLLLISPISSFIMNGSNQLRRHGMIFPRNSARTSPSLTTVSATLGGTGSVPMMSLGLWTWALCELGGLLFCRYKPPFPLTKDMLIESKIKIKERPWLSIAKLSNYQVCFHSKVMSCILCVQTCNMCYAHIHKCTYVTMH